MVFGCHDSDAMSTMNSPTYRLSILVVGAVLWMSVTSGTRAQAPAPPSETFEMEPVELIEMPVPHLELEDGEVRAQLLGLRGEVDAAIAARAEVSRGPTTDSELANLLGELGGLYYFYDLYDVAFPTLTNASRLAPLEPRWRHLLGILFRLQGRLEDAEREFSKALELAPEATWTRYRRGSVRLDLSRFEEAAADFRGVLERDPDHPAALGSLGNLLVHLERHAEALPLFERALMVQPQATSLNHGLGLALRAAGRVDEARTALQRNRQGQPRYFDPWVAEIERRIVNRENLFHAGNAAIRKGELDDAIRFLETFLQEDPEHSEGRLSLANAYLLAGRRAEGIERLRGLLDEEPSVRGAARLMADALAKSGRLEESLAFYEKAHAQDPEAAATVADWATVLARLGRGAEGLARLRPLVEGRAQNTYARLKYAILLATGDGQGEARRLLEELAMAPGLRGERRAEAWYHVGRLDRLEGREESAEAAWEEALRLDPESDLALSALAPALARRGQLEASIGLYRRWVDLVPEEERAHFGLAMALLVDGEDAVARNALEGATEALPESTGLRHLLARLLAASSDDRVRDGPRAVAISRELLRVAPGADVAETLAMALAEIGEFEEAVRLQGQVIARSRARGEPAASLAVRQARLERYRRDEVVRDPWKK